MTSPTTISRGRGIYAWLCTECNHLASDHRWDHKRGGSLAEGPYVCPCGCTQPQAGAFAPMSRADFDAWLRRAIEAAS